MKLYMDYQKAPRLFLNMPVEPELLIKSVSSNEGYEEFGKIAPQQSGMNKLIQSDLFLSLEETKR